MLDDDLDRFANVANVRAESAANETVSFPIAPLFDVNFEKAY